MKLLVNLIQILIIAVILYPIYYVWETDHISQFCREIRPGITDETLMSLAEQYHLNLSGLDNEYIDKGPWLAEVRAKSSFSDYRCEISGIGNKVAHAKIMDEE